MSITILSTTDVHGYPDHRLDQIEAVRHNVGPHLLIDNGDFLLGHPYASYAYDQYELSPLVDLANRIGYDVMIPGNHDLDMGLDWLKMQVQHLDADYICANLLDKQDQPIFPPYVIKEVGGYRIAVIGLLTSGYSQIAVEAQQLETSVIDCIETLSCIIKELDRATASIDLILVAYHGGMTRNPETGEVWTYPSVEDDAYRLLEDFPQIDALICGHQHFSRVGLHPNGTSLVQPGAFGRQLGIQIFNQDEEGQLVFGEHSLHELCSSKTEPIDVIDAKYQDWLQRPVDLQRIEAWIQQHYPADYYLLDYQAETLEEFLQEIKGPFPLIEYIVTGRELREAATSRGYEVNVSNEGSYTVISRMGFLPSSRIRQPLLLNLLDVLLFDEVVFK